MSDSAQQLGQNEIERLLKEAQQGAAAPGAAAASEPAPPPAASAPAGDTARKRPAGRSTDEGQIAQPDVEFLLRQATQALASVGEPQAEFPPGVSPFQYEEFGGLPASVESASLDLIRDVELDLKIELGRTQMQLDDVLKLRRGSVVTLDKLAGDPVDIYVNGRLIARGEVLVLNDNFCVRVAELIAGQSPNE